MRIAILTLPLHTNYGGILQAYALQTVLERMGHKVTVITRDKRERITVRTYLSLIPRIFNKLRGRNGSVLKEFNWNKMINTMQSNVVPFIKKYINEDNRNIEEIPHNDYECIIVGSDQIWRPLYICNTLRTKVENAFLEFAYNWDIHRIAYAASFGTDESEFTEPQIANITHLLQKFKAVSVREESGVSICKRLFNINAVSVLDPTLLLNKEDYIKLFTSAKIRKSKGTLMYYVLDNTDIKESIKSLIVKRTKLTPFQVGAKIDDWQAPINERIQPPVEEWLRGFYDAEMVVTDSFHACVFSIIFEKDFIVIGNKERGMTRFRNLLAIFGLESRLINSTDDITSQLSGKGPKINWNNVNSILLEKQKFSYAFLENSLS